MGLKEYIKAGASLKRSDVSLQTTAVTQTGSIDALGTAYILLQIQTDNPCRFRLYDDIQSLSNSTEISRAFGDTNVPSYIALIGDFSMSAAGTYTIDPGIYGIVSSSSYYRVGDVISGQYPNITLTKFSLEDRNVSLANRKTFDLITGSLTSGQRISGSVVNSSIPNTYLFVSAALAGTTDGVIRLRVYSLENALTNTTEVTRPFHSESTVSSLLIDAILSGSDTTYFSPKIIGANLQNVGENLSILKGFSLNGYNNLYYIMENVSSLTSPFVTTASLHLFALED